MDISNLINNFKNNKILIIGDIMLDTYIMGKVDRVSPEAPVPVVDITEKINKLGGAANVALNIKELGAIPIICSIVGKDHTGAELEYLFKCNDLNVKYLFKTKKRKTTNKTRIIGNNFQLLRIDDENKNDIDDELFDKIKDNIIIAVAENKINGIIIQDYDKGVISRKMIEYIIKLSEKRGIPVFIDPKIRNFDYYGKCDIFKPNFNELKRGLKLDLDVDNWEYIKPHVEKLILNKNINTFYTTLGEKGILMSYNDKNKIIHKHIKSIKRNIADVSGAGDTVISVASLMTINGFDRELTANISNLAGGLVCEKIGVVPINKNELLNEIKKYNF